MAADINIKIGAQTDEFVKKLGAVEKRLKRAGDKMKRTGMSLMTSLTVPLGLVGGAAIKAAGDFEAMQNGLTAIMGDAAAASAELDKLEEAAKNPGLGFEQAVQGSVRLQSIGIDAEMARNNMLQMGNAIALVGGGAEELDRATLAMQQIGAKGKISAEEINQLNEVIPQIRQVMNDTFGTSDGEELAKMGVDANMFIEQITQGLAKLPRAQGGINNAIENAGIAMNKFLMTIGNELNETFNLQENVDKFSQKLDEIATKFKNLDENTQKIIVTIVTVVAALGPALYAFGQMKSLAGTLVGNYKDLVTGISKMSAMVRTATASQAGLNAVMAANPVTIIVLAVAALVTALVLLYKKNEKAREIMDKFYNNVLKPFGQFLFDLGKIIFDVFTFFLGKARDVFKAVGGLIMWLVGKFLDFLNRFPLVGKVLKWLKEKFSQAIAFIGKLFNNLPAFFAGLTAEARNLADKMKAFFTRLALSAQIIAKKVKRALTISPSERKKLGKEIEELSKEREKSKNVGKDFGEAFREGFAEEVERQKLTQVSIADTGDGGDGGDGGGDGGGGGGVDIATTDGADAEADARKKAEEERLAAEKQLADRIEQIRRQTIDTNLATLEDGINKEKQIQQARFDNEIADLQAQKIDKESLTDSEIKYNDSVDALIEAKKNEHLQALADIDKKYADKAKADTEATTAFKMQKLDEEAALQLAIANQTINDEEKLAEERKKIAADLAQAKLDLINAEIAATGNATEEQIKQINELKSVISSMTGSPAVSSLEEMMTRIAEETGPIVTAALSDMSVGIVEGIGDIAAGTGNMQTVLSGILGTVAGMMSQLGKLAVGTGLAVEGIKKALESLNPIAAIAAGVALLALSRVVSARAASIGQAGQDRLPAFANGGLVTSPTLGMFGEAGPEALIPKKRLDSLLARAENGGVGGDGILTTRISGSDLEIVLDKTRRRNNRVR